MRVAFDARLLGHAATGERGVGRYARCLLDALVAAGRDVAVLADLPRPAAPERFAEGFEHFLLARDVRARGAAVLHTPSVDNLSLRPGVPQVVTVHDLEPLLHAERYLRSGLKHRIRYAAVRRSARVIVPTRVVALDAERLLGLGPERVAVVAEAPAPVFQPMSDPRAALDRLRLPDRFLLWVGGLDPPDPRKQLPRLLAAVMERDGLPLVLAGRPDPAAPSLAREGRIEVVGRVSDEELAALYGAAEALVVSSSAEGYGLPAVEALACGSPVAAFDIPATRETLGRADGVEFAPEGDFGALLEAAERLAGSYPSRPSRTWDDVAAETWAVYESALGRGTDAR